GSVARRGDHLVPPLRPLGRLGRKGETGQMAQRFGIDPALEIDDRAHRLPVADPAPAIELRLTGTGEIELHLVALHAEQEPALLLADARRLLIAADVARRQPIPQPVAGTPHQAHIVGREADLFVQLAEDCLLRLLPDAHATLRELPPASTGAPTQEYAPVAP